MNEQRKKQLQDEEEKKTARGEDCPTAASSNQKLESSRVSITSPTAASCFGRDKSTSMPSTETGFVTKFFNSSRLSHLSRWGAVARRDASLNNNSNQNNKSNSSNNEKSKIGIPSSSSTSPSAPFHPGGEASHENNASRQRNIETIRRRSDSKEKILMHVDMDCFFVSVVLRRRPDLKDKPVGVGHYRRRNQNNGSNSADPGGGTSVDTSSSSSTSELAAVNYIARSYGLKNGQFVGDALKKCPNLVVVPYAFDEIKATSDEMYRAMCDYTDQIEGVSVDEVFLDVTETVWQRLEAHQREEGRNEEDELDDAVVEASLELAEEIRQHVFRVTEGCPCSVGISANKLCARMATKKAKPDGKYFLKTGPGSAIEEVFAPLRTRELHGIGWSIEQKLEDLFEAKTCGDLQRVSLARLQKEFGDKKGSQLYSFCRGIDDRPLKLSTERKSVSAEISWGVRFENAQQVESFTAEMCREVVRRLKEISSKAKHITVKAKRKKESLKTFKYMGHGPCDNLSKGSGLATYTDSWETINSNAQRLLNSLHIPPDKLRGLAIMMTKLSDSSSVAQNSDQMGSMFKYLNQGKEKSPNAPNDSHVRANVPRDKEVLSVPRREAGNPLLAEENPSKVRNPFMKRFLERGQEPDSKRTKDDASLGILAKDKDFVSPITEKRQAFKDFWLSPSRVDLDVFNALPLEIREELKKDFESRPKSNNTDLSSIFKGRISGSQMQSNPPIGVRKFSELQVPGEVSLPPPSEVDPEVFAALPDDVKKDMQLAYSRAYAKQDRSHSCFADVEEDVDEKSRNENSIGMPNSNRTEPAKIAHKRQSANPDRPGSFSSKTGKAPNALQKSITSFFSFKDTAASESDIGKIPTAYSEEPQERKVELENNFYSEGHARRGNEVMTSKDAVATLANRMPKPMLPVAGNAGPAKSTEEHNPYKAALEVMGRPSHKKSSGGGWRGFGSHSEYRKFRGIEKPRPGKKAPAAVEYEESIQYAFKNTVSNTKLAASPAPLVEEMFQERKIDLDEGTSKRFGNDAPSSSGEPNALSSTQIVVVSLADNAYSDSRHRIIYWDLAFRDGIVPPEYEEQTLRELPFNVQWDLLEEFLRATPKAEQKTEAPERPSKEYDHLGRGKQQPFVRNRNIGNGYGLGPNVVPGPPPMEPLVGVGEVGHELELNPTDDQLAYHIEQMSVEDIQSLSQEWIESRLADIRSENIDVDEQKDEDVGKLSSLFSALAQPNVMRLCDLQTVLTSFRKQILSACTSQRLYESFPNARLWYTYVFNSTLDSVQQQVRRHFLGCGLPIEPITQCPENLARL
eukprot:Nk52_evm16s151 gene=Nk52_evmTU16s151